MSPPDEKLALAAFVQEEMVDEVARKMSHVLDRAPAVVRLRLLAFMHLIERPEAMSAKLEVEPSGLLRLTLETPAAP